MLGEADERLRPGFINLEHLGTYAHVDKLYSLAWGKSHILCLSLISKAEQTVSECKTTWCQVKPRAPIACSQCAKGIGVTNW